jgi:hypothetical protein
MITAKQIGDAMRRNALAMRLDNEKRVTGVSSFAEAAGIWCELRDASGLGASASPKVTIVDVDTGTVLAHVSYNGRVWLGETWRQGMRPLL